MTLADFTSPGLVIPRLRGRDSVSVIKELSQALQQESRVTDWLDFYHAALNREFLASTEMGNGIAIPHARLAGVKELSYALGRLDPPLRWGNAPGGPASIVILLAIPATEPGQYLLLISGLARMAREGALLENVSAASDSRQIYEALKAVELRRNPTPGPAKGVGR